MNKMIWHVLVVVLNGCLCQATWPNFFNIDPYPDPSLIKQDQVYFNRKERFIKFDTKDNELEIELGISIPFIKVPLATERDIYGEEKKAAITINGPGIIVATMLVLTSFIIIPLLFTTTHIERERSYREGDTGQFWTSLQNLDEALFKNGIDSSSCVQKSLCWMASESEGGKRSGLGTWINDLLESWWYKRLMGFPKHSRQIGSGTCNVRHSGCTLTPEHIQSFVETVKRDHQVHGWNATTFV